MLQRTKAFGVADSRGYAAQKRAIDLIFALAVVILGGWLMLAVWLLIRVESKGPGLFMQERVGQHGDLITVYKFRTMHVGTREAGTHEIAASAVTRVGRLLRRTKIDELPQVINIFRNELSLVGPRPCLPSQTELVDARGAAGVLTVKPGITGLAQVNAIDMSDPYVLTEWDSRYLTERSVGLDLRIIVSTFAGSGRGDRVIRPSD